MLCVKPIRSAQQVRSHALELPVADRESRHTLCPKAKGNAPLETEESDQQGLVEKMDAQGGQPARDVWGRPAA